MKVLANDARPDEGGELGHGAALRIRGGKLEDRRALARDGIRPDLADPNRCDVSRTVGVGMRHRAHAGRSESGSQTREVGVHSGEAR